MIRLIAVDMDGTFLTSEKTFDISFYDLYQEMKKRDIYFCVASGNQYECLMERFEPIKDEIIYICENATKVMYKNEEIYLDILKNEDYIQALNACRDHLDWMVVVCGRHGAYIHRDYQAQEETIHKHYRNYCYVDNYEDIDDDILKLSVFDLKAEAKKTAAIIQSQLPAGLKCLAATESWSDIAYETINKGVGMKMIQEKFHLKREECVAFGDEMNDIELLESVSESYAMKNANPRVKEIAKYTLDFTNDENGVLRKIKELLSVK